MRYADSLHSAGNRCPIDGQVLLRLTQPTPGLLFAGQVTRIGSGVGPEVWLLRGPFEAPAKSCRGLFYKLSSLNDPLEGVQELALP